MSAGYQQHTEVVFQQVEKLAKKQCSTAAFQQLIYKYHHRL